MTRSGRVFAAILRAARSAQFRAARQPRECRPVYFDFLFPGILGGF